MHQKQCLTRQRDGTTIPHFTEPHFRNLCAGARGFAAPAPVRHAVHSANGVRPKTLNGARRRRYPAAHFLPFVNGDLGRQPENRGVDVMGCRRLEGEDGDEDGWEVEGFEDSGHDLGEASLKLAWGIREHNGLRIEMGLKWIVLMKEKKLDRVCKIG